MITSNSRNSPLAVYTSIPILCKAFAALPTVALSTSSPASLFAFESLVIMVRNAVPILAPSCLVFSITLAIIALSCSNDNPASLATLPTFFTASDIPAIPLE